jgi:2-haloacid dehalogenase
MVAQKSGIDIDDEEIESILEVIKRLPPHPDVIPALTRLGEAGFTMVALTNGNQNVAEEQLAYAKIDQFFKHIISVENVGYYKPHAQTYDFIIKKSGVESKDAILVAAHGWDIVGAKRAGLQTAFIEREGKSVYPLDKSPDFRGETVLEIAEKLSKGLGKR